MKENEHILFGQKERNSNLELLRIISMVLIVMSHSDDWMGLAKTYQTTVCVNKFITDWLHLGGQIGVGCFLLISGYFMVNQQITLKKILRLWGEVLFYSISVWIVYAVVKLCAGSDVSFFSLQTIKAFFPVLFTHYWFVTAYIILMILSPFFNKLISIMDKHLYQALLTALIVIFILFDGGIPGVLDDMSEGRLIPVFIIYFIAGYIKKYDDSSKNNAKKHFGVAILGYILLYGTFIGVGIIGDILNSEMIIKQCYFWRPLHSPIVLIINVELFLAFLRMRFKKSKKINAIASNTLGVYLIHSHQIIENLVLPKIFPVYKETNSLRLLVYSIGSVAIVYIVCTIIDMIRQRTVEKIWVRFLDKHINKFEKKSVIVIKKTSQKVMSLLNRFYNE